MAIALVFPGQGSQSVGMGGALAAAFPEARAVLQEADDALGFSLTKLLAEGPADELKKTANTQPAILAVSVAAHRALAARAGARLVPSFFAGHSLGEYSALVAAGAFTLGDALRAVRARGTFMQEAVAEGEGAMAAVLVLDAAKVMQACAQARSELPGRVVEAANFNSPDQTVISGHADAVDRASALCKAAGARRALKLPVSAPFHSSLMSPVMPRLRQVLAPLPIGKLAAPVIANTTAQPNSDPARVVDLLIDQVSAPVRWTETVAAMTAAGVTLFLELGPGQVLSGLIGKISPGVKAISVEDPAGVESALAALSGVTSEAVGG